MKDQFSPAFKVGPNSFNKMLGLYTVFVVERVYVLFSSILLGRRKSDYGEICAVKCHLGSDRRTRTRGLVIESTRPRGINEVAVKGKQVCGGHILHIVLLQIREYS